MAKKIIFRGQISPIMSAIRLGGDTMRLSFDVPLTERLNAIGLLALTDQPLRFTIEVDKEQQATPTEKKQPKGEWRFYWQQMHRPDVFGANFTTFPDLQEFLGVDAEHVREALRAHFKVDSLTFVSPTQFEQFVTKHGLSEGLITMSRNADVRAAEKATA